MAQHHYVVTYDTELNEWTMDPEMEANCFPEGCIWDGDEWHQPFLGDGEYYPNEEELSEFLSVQLMRMNEEINGKPRNK